MSLLVTWCQSRNLRQTLFIIALITLFTIVVAKGQLFHCKEQVVYFYVLRKVKVWKIIFPSEPILNFKQSLVFLLIRLEVNFKNLTLILEQSCIGCDVCQLSPKQESMNSHAFGKSQIDIKCCFRICAFRCCSFMADTFKVESNCGMEITGLKKKRFEETLKIADFLACGLLPLSKSIQSFIDLTVVL